MPESAESAAISVPLAEVARIAGVGRAAVSNWRRRHETFPSPVGGTDASPLFSLAEVEAWLHREGKLKAAVGPLERLWPEYEALGDRDAMGLLVAEVGLRLYGEPSEPKDSGQATTSALGAGQSGLDERQSALLERTLRLAEGKGAAETFGFLLERWLRTHVRQIAVTPPLLADLMAEIASAVHEEEVRVVLDPACGTGCLLLAAGRRWDGSGLAELRGQDSDPVLASLTRARLAATGYTGPALPEVTVTAADTLRADAQADVQADVILCNPPSNERDWGHAELATDPRWVFGQPPRTESELAWVQHIAAALAPEGVGVVVLPPAVAARRAGRRIRAGLLRAGVLRTVIALPPGAAPPHGVGLHLWVLRAAGTGGEPGASPGEVTLVDTVAGQSGTGTGSGGTGGSNVDWKRITEQVVKVLRGSGGPGSVRVPVIDLLDEAVDLTPARHIPRSRTADLVDMRRSWALFDAHASELHDAAGVLSALEPVEAGDIAPLITVAELERAGALEIRGGQTLPEAEVERGVRPADGVRVLTSLRRPGGPELWLPAAEVARGEKSGALTVTASQDVVLSVLARDFDVHVDTEAPSVLGPQLCALRVDPSVLDPWFLAGCLRAPDNARQAGTHASTTSRVDVRRLRVPRFSLEEQRRYGEIYRRITTFEKELQGIRQVGGELVRSLGDLLAHGRLPRA
ncbi:N-6 DNA methylase [Streptomyces rochei]|uniref:N-6 DNA methylase n=1 Tax=Streptomyces rochei TaxID=1928 RepID=UPI002ACD915C|nr:N-6 DNA methylase [Streptomyces rochei]WQC16265.1 N-6 DNA methylase [Streptomyces rochei]